MKPISEILNAQYEALTEDLDKGAREEKFTEEWIIDQSLRNERRHLVEAATDTGDISAFTTVAMPLVRKIFSNLIAMKLVSIQPMSQPTGKIFYLDMVYGSAPTGGSPGDSLYNTGYAPGGSDFAYSTRLESGAVKDIQLTLTSTDITAIEKALKALWTMELQQDLKAYHGLSIEGEIMGVLQEQIIREIDGLILKALLDGATAGNVNWNTTGYLTNDLLATSDNRAYKKTLYEAFIDASNYIYKKRFRYPTWIVGHPDAIVRLEKLEEWQITQKGVGRGAADEFAIGRHLAGTLGGRFQVWKDPFWSDSTKFLLGYKGTQWSDTVGFYAPYIPLYTTPLIVDPNDFTPRRGLMSRFAYGCLIGDGLATVTLTTS